MLLAIDTSTRYAGVAVADGERLLAARSWYSTSSHTSELMPAVAGLLDGLGLSPRDLQDIAVALGPGAFSALRVGVSAAKGLALAAGKPLAGVPTLDLEAFPYLESGLPVCALLDSGRTEVAAALFGADGARMGEDRMGRPGEIITQVAGPTIFCGEGVRSWGTLIREQLGPQAVVVQPYPAARLWSLAELGRRRLDRGDSGRFGPAATPLPADAQHRRPQAPRPNAPAVLTSALVASPYGFRECLRFNGK